MRLSEIRPCDKCGGGIYPNFYILRYSLAFFKPSAVNETLGMAQFFGGGEAGLKLAGVFTDDNKSVIIAGEEDKSLMNEFFICQPCMVKNFVSVMQLAETVNERKENTDE